MKDISAYVSIPKVSLVEIESAIMTIFYNISFTVFTRQGRKKEYLENSPSDGQPDSIALFCVYYFILFAATFKLILRMQICFFPLFWKDAHFNLSSIWRSRIHTQPTIRKTNFCRSIMEWGHTGKLICYAEDHRRGSRRFPPTSGVVSQSFLARPIVGVIRNILK